MSDTPEGMSIREQRANHADPAREDGPLQGRQDFRQMRRRVAMGHGSSGQGGARAGQAVRPPCISSIDTGSA